MALNGFNDEQIKEAGWVAQSVTGASAYLYSTDYDRDKFKKELGQIEDFMKKKVKKAA